MDFGSKFTYVNLENEDNVEIEVQENEVVSNLFENEQIQDIVQPQQYKTKPSPMQPQQPMQQLQPQPQPQPQPQQQQQSLKQRVPARGIMRNPLSEQPEEQKTNFFSNLFSFGSKSSAPAPPPPPPILSPLLPNKPFAKKRKVKIADTNVVNISLGSLVQSAQLSTGDSLNCKQCKACFNIHSKVASEKLWTCEFCCQENPVTLEPEEFPKNETLDYILSAPTERRATTDDDYIIFCIDISGSMGISYESSNKLKLKKPEQSDRLQSFGTEFDRTAQGTIADQWLPNEKRNVTYVTRLQCVQAAISTQIEEISKTSPNKRIGIITFNNEVTIVGDDGKTTIVAGDKLKDKDQLIQIGNSIQLTKKISETKDGLLSRLFALEENYSTALGPALCLAIGMCGSKSGSKIILCTDGLSNVGVGALDGLTTIEEKEQVSKFYEDLGMVAKLNGNTISVISIKGSESSIENLGKLTELTAGTVDRIEPLDIEKNFASILANPVLATNVQLTIILHQGLYIKDERKDDKTKTFQIVDIGNVTHESTISFEYGVKNDEKSVKLFQDIKQLPFQLQIHYQKLDGMRIFRVITNLHNITFEREKAEEQANVEVLGINAVQQTAKIASNGDYVGSRFANLTYKNVMHRAASHQFSTEEQKTNYKKWESHGKEFEDIMSNVQATEKTEKMDVDDDEEDEYYDNNNESEKVEVKKTPSKTAVRKQRRSDTTSNMLYQFKSMDKAKF